MAASLTFNSAYANWVVAGCFAALSLGGCTAVDPLKTAPASADKPWQSPETNRLAKKLDPLTQDPTPHKIDPAHTYTLVDLVDLALRTNRTTRVAWQAAREAAIGVGLSQAEFYQHCRRNRTAPSQQLSRGWPLAPVKSRPLSSEGNRNARKKEKERG
jgi:outer membrane protein